MKLWVLVAVIIIEITADSCYGNCGGSGGKCWCDSYCTGYGDCCPDYNTYCNLSSDTCEGNCGYKAGDCYCDNSCKSYNDCCIDFDQYCTVISCEGNCFSLNIVQGCYCDSLCTFYGDCCNDFQEVCNNPQSMNEPDQAGTCDGYCGDIGSDWSCFCDSVCKNYGDCCDDYDMFCVVEDPVYGTCDGYCGYKGSDNYCYCDHLCKEYNDCCVDFDTYCEPWGAPKESSMLEDLCANMKTAHCKEGDAGCVWDKETKVCYYPITTMAPESCDGMKGSVCKAVTGENGYFCEWDKTTKSCSEIPDPCAKKTKKNKCNKKTGCAWDSDEKVCFTDFNPNEGSNCSTLEMDDCKAASECKWKADKVKCKDA